GLGFWAGICPHLPARTRTSISTMATLRRLTERTPCGGPENKACRQFGDGASRSALAAASTGAKGPHRSFLASPLHMSKQVLGIAAAVKPERTRLGNRPLLAA